MAKENASMITVITVITAIVSLPPLLRLPSLLRLLLRVVGMKRARRPRGSLYTFVLYRVVLLFGHGVITIITVIVIITNLCVPIARGACDGMLLPYYRYY